MPYLHIAAIRVRNFRNLADVVIGGLPAATVVVGENNSGKSNLLFALRLVLDPVIRDSSRSLRAEDFWDGLPAPSRGAEISVVVELGGFDGDADARAVLADSIVAVRPLVARLTYLFRPSGRRPATDSERDDYEFLVFGGVDESNRIGGDIRRLISVRVLPALRDAEGDLESWVRSPLRTLLEALPITSETLAELTNDMSRATESLLKVDVVRTLEEAIIARLGALAGSAFDPGASLGAGPVRPDELMRAVRLFVESGRGLASTGLGIANLVFLTLLLESISSDKVAGEIVTSIVAVEEPEAHLHPHVQRALFGYLLRAEPALIVTTHSPQLASVAPLRSIVLLRRGGNGTQATSVVNAGFSKAEIVDLERYLDAVRADFLFARAVILVEGPAELYLVPAYAAAMGTDLDQIGVTCCSVQGIDFAPYVKLVGAAGLAIPYVVVTDGDADGLGGKGVPGLVRGVRLLDPAARAAVQAEIASSLYRRARKSLMAEGIFVGQTTLEAEIARVDPESVISAFNDLNSGSAVRARFKSAVERRGTRAGRRELISRIESRGKGRFAQRLAAYVTAEKAPPYIRAAIERVVKDIS